MGSRVEFGGNGSSHGLIDVQELSPGFVLFKANPQKPPPEDEMPYALGQCLSSWVLKNAVRVREALPIVRLGNPIGLFVWFDRPAP
jgi:hypothetical protein